MILKSPNLQAKATSSVTTPPSGEVTLYADSLNSHLAQKDANGKLVDLAATAGQQDSVGFDTTIRWDFDTTDDGWTTQNGTGVWSSAGGGSLLCTQNTTSFGIRIDSPTGLSINGARFTHVKMGITRLSGSVFQSLLWYATPGHGVGATNQHIAPKPIAINTINEMCVVDWDMEFQSAGSPDWISSTINSLSIFLGLNSAGGGAIGDQFRIHWIAVGRNEPARIPAGVAVNQSYILKRNLGC